MSNDLDHEDYLAYLPGEVPVPEWERDDDNVTITLSGKVSGHLDIRALTPDDVIMTGVLTFRGNDYSINWQHTNDAGDPKGYFYQNVETPGGGWKNEQVFGVLPTPGDGDGHLHYAISEWLGGAPKTYRQPMLAAVKEAVQIYLTSFTDRAKESRRRNLTQNVNRAASAYNRAAEEAAKLLEAYEAAVAAAEAQA